MATQTVIAGSVCGMETFNILFGQWENGQTLAHIPPFLVVLNLSPAHEPLLFYCLSLPFPFNLLLSSFILTRKQSSNIHWLPTLLNGLGKFQ